MNQCAKNRVYETRGERDGRFFSRFFLSGFIFLSSLSNSQKNASYLYVCNPKHPTRLDRACLGLRKWEASKSSRFFSLPNFLREKLPFLVSSMYMRICALIQLNDTIVSNNERGKFRPHTTLRFAEISVAFWSNIGPFFYAHSIIYLPYLERIIFSNITL